MEHDNNGPLLGLIHPSLLKPGQVARWTETGVAPTCKLLRKPVSLEELKGHQHRFAILHDNDVMIYVTTRKADISNRAVKNNSCVCFKFGGDVVFIVGPNDNAIAQTLSCLMDLEKESTKSYSFEVSGSWGNIFDFSAAGSQCLERLCEFAFSNKVEFHRMLLSAEQSAVLATRRHPMNLSLRNCRFADGGTAFVDELKVRRESFGSLQLCNSSPFDARNMQQFLQVDCLDHFGAKVIKGTFAPLSTKADSVHLNEETQNNIDADDIGNLNICARKLSLCLTVKRTFQRIQVLGLLRRLAQLGHLIELKIAFWSLNDSHSVPNANAITQELIRTVKANTSLQVLDLTTHGIYLNWKTRHLKELFDGVKDHEALRTLKISCPDGGDCEDVCGPSFIHLRRLLSHKRNLAVVGDFGGVYTDGDLVDEIYSFNRFFMGSASIVDEALSRRSSLVTTALVESASYDFRLNALLLANHADILCELIQFVDSDVMEVQERPPRGPVRKRRRN
ncbi:hypothetical protein FisN_18Hu133 [Fistulifera solaris]|uniref:Uncharacterized protein n=1 Tax=Fistulifera solaris TaxID=1519565 RepID=A0A1Z5JV46_FISSO|nr:hypothetical protein FisN_18Hu133 [Fistulifera solaris]|eukprot:GAX17925.1 hypothetical protein FisN_18Hu133 [Fistulifera solaris]